MFILIDRLLFLFQEIIESAAPPPARVSFDVNNCSTVPNGYGLIEREGEVRLSTESRVCEPLVPGASDIPLYLRLLAAIISEEDFTHGNRDLEFDTYETGFELDRELGSNGLSHADNFKFSGHTPFNGYKMALKTEHDEAEIDALGISSTSIYSNFDDSVNGVLSDQGLIPGMVCSEFQYDDMQINEKLLLEVQSVGIFPESMVGFYFYVNFLMVIFFPCLLSFLHFFLVVCDLGICMWALSTDNILVLLILAAYGFKCSDINFIPFL